MGYWKSKVLPKLKKAFDINSSKKAAAAEACKSFDKDEINKEFEEKKTELQPKVVEIYEASSTEIKAVVKERKDAGIKKNATGVQTFLEELVKIEFPGSKQVSELSTKFGPVLVSGPVLFVFEKVSTFVVIEEETKTEETSGGSGGGGGGEVKEKEKEVTVVEGEKAEEIKEAAVVEEKTKASEAVAPPAPAATESAKVEEAAVLEQPKA